MALTEYITPQLQAAGAAWKFVKLLQVFPPLCFFVSRTNYQGNRSLLKTAMCRTDERDHLEVIAGDPLSSSQQFAGRLRSGPGAVDLGCSLRGRAHIAACLQNPPAATCALACFAASSFRLWYVPQA